MQIIAKLLEEEHKDEDVSNDTQSLIPHHLQELTNDKVEKIDEKQEILEVRRHDKDDTAVIEIYEDIVIDDEHKVDRKRKAINEPSSMVHRLKCKVRTMKADPDFETTKTAKNAKLRDVDSFSKLPSKCFPGQKKKIYNYMSTIDQEFLDTFFQKKGNGMIWGNSIEKCVLLSDLLALIGNNAISNLVIDAFSDILQRRVNLDRKPDADYFFFSSSAFTAVKDNLEQHIDRLIYSKMELSTKYRYNFFPMNSKESYHWTLLMLDTEEGIWTLLNPLRVQKGKHDTFLDDAYLMKKTIEDYHNSIIHLLTDIAHIDIVVDQKCPQQFANTLDCGPLVCFYMEEISGGRLLKENLPRETIKKFRATIASCILNDPGMTCDLSLP